MVLTFVKVLAHVLALARLFICDIKILISMEMLRVTRKRRDKVIGNGHIGHTD